MLFLLMYVGTHTHTHARVCLCACAHVHLHCIYNVNAAYSQSILLSHFLSLRITTNHTSDLNHFIARNNTPNKVTPRPDPALVLQPEVTRLATHTLIVSYDHVGSSRPISYQALKLVAADYVTTRCTPPHS